MHRSNSATADWIRKPATRCVWSMRETTPARSCAWLRTGVSRFTAWLQRPVPFKPLEFAIPPETTAKGSLTLSVFREPATGGAGRGNAVAEVWLIRQ